MVKYLYLPLNGLQIYQIPVYKTWQTEPKSKHFIRRLNIRNFIFKVIVFKFGELLPLWKLAAIAKF